MPLGAHATVRALRTTSGPELRSSRAECLARGQSVALRGSMRQCGNAAMRWLALTELGERRSGRAQVDAAVLGCAHLMASFMTCDLASTWVL